MVAIAPWHGSRHGQVPVIADVGLTAEATIRWTASHMRCMVFHMKTTLNISDATMLEVKKEAVRRRQTMSELVESALRAAVKSGPRKTTLPALPAFSGGGLRVDVANRDALYSVMEG